MNGQFEHLLFLALLYIQMRSRALLATDICHERKLLKSEVLSLGHQDQGEDNKMFVGDSCAHLC